MVRIRTDIKTSESYKPQDVAATNEGQNPFVRTTEKTRQIGEQITAPKKEGATPSRKIVQIPPGDDLAQRVSNLDKHWDEMELEDLAEEIVDLEKRVSLLDTDDPAARRIQEAVQTRHHEFVNPILRTLPAFIENVSRISKQIIQQNSLQPLEALDDMQRREILYYAAVTA